MTIMYFFSKIAKNSHEFFPSVRIVLGPYATEPLSSRSVRDAGEPALLGPGPTDSLPRDIKGPWKGTWVEGCLPNGHLMGKMHF